MKTEILIIYAMIYALGIYLAFRSEKTTREAKKQLKELGK